MNSFAVVCLLLVASSSFAQPVSIGIKGGVPITDVFRVDNLGTQHAIEMQRYTVGPVVDIGLPLGFGIEVGAMYKRFHQKSVAVTTTGYVVIDDETGYPITQSSGVSAVGHSWEFPLAVQYRFFKSAVQPYVEGGVSFNRLSNVYTAQQTPFPRPFQLPYTIEHMRQSFTRWGPLAGVGLDVKLHGVHLTPGVRYTHFKHSTVLTGCVAGDCRGNKSVDFLLGVTLSPF